MQMQAVNKLQNREFVAKTVAGVVILGAKSFQLSALCAVGDCNATISVDSGTEN